MALLTAAGLRQRDGEPAVIWSQADAGLETGSRLRWVGPNHQGHRPGPDPPPSLL